MVIRYHFQVVRTVQNCTRCTATRLAGSRFAHTGITTGMWAVPGYVTLE